MEFPLDGISLLWRLTGDEIVMIVGVSGTWPVIAGIGYRKGE